MKYMSTADIREAFLQYFSDKHMHHIERSASLIPSDDPSLLFTNAGMVPYKRIFQGEENTEHLRKQQVKSVCAPVVNIMI